MAGASDVITIEIDDREIRDGLRALETKLGDLRPVFRDIGEALLNSTRERFNTQTAPDGSPWAQLSPDYKQRKKKHSDLILTLNGYLRGTLNYQATRDELRVGTPMIYGAAHQFGRPDINLPAREFLGLSDDDSAMILDTLSEWLLAE